MKGLLKLGLLAYLGLALFTRYKEANGELHCECDPDCWCKQSGLSLFRWVFPIGHKP
jgi:hypothetical protein